jgi:mannose-1-phosphate guanylyltransferase/phosphomannomutase
MERIALEPVDALTVTSLVDNVTDSLLADQGPARRPATAAGPRLTARFMAGGESDDALQAEHGFAALVTVTKGGRETRILFDAGRTGVAEAGMKVVLDAAGGAASLVLPSLLGRVDVDVLTVDNRLSESATSGSLAEHLRRLERLGELVSSSGAAFGVRFDPVGERITLVDEHGRLVHDDRALLVLLDLVAAERHRGVVALPVTTTRVAEQVTQFHGTGITWTSTSAHDLTLAACAGDVLFAGDGRGGYVVPEFSSAIDGIAAFVRLLGLVARTRLTLSQIDARIPHAHVVRRVVPTPWAVKGQIMRTVVEAAEGREIDTTDGVRVVEPDGSWALVLPDPTSAVTHLWAEAGSATAATGLLARWAGVVERAAAPAAVPAAPPEVSPGAGGPA